MCCRRGAALDVWAGVGMPFNLAGRVGAPGEIRTPDPQIRSPSPGLSLEVPTPTKLRKFSALGSSSSIYEAPRVPCTSLHFPAQLHRNYTRLPAAAAAAPWRTTSNLERSPTKFRGVRTAVRSSGCHTKRGGEEEFGRLDMLVRSSGEFQNSKVPLYDLTVWPKEVIRKPRMGGARVRL